MFHNQNNGTKQLRDNRALFAAENTGASRTKDEDEDESKLRNWANTAIVTGSAVRGLLAEYEFEKEQETLDARNSAHFDCRR
jgi:hypothetical protein